MEKHIRYKEKVFKEEEWKKLGTLSLKEKGEEKRVTRKFINKLKNEYKKNG